MRLAGTINHKSRRVGARARGRPRAGAVHDRGSRRRPARPAVRGECGRARVAATARPRTRTSGSRRPSTSGAWPGSRVPRGGLVSCPVPGPPRPAPVVQRRRQPEQGWCCHSAGCGARGAIYDLASVLDGGPWGPALRGDGVRARPRARDRRLRAAAMTAPRRRDAACTRPRASAGRRYVVTRARRRRRRDRRPPRRRLPQPAAAARGRAGAHRAAGRGAIASEPRTRWTVAVAGGRRTITLTLHDAATPLTAPRRPSSAGSPGNVSARLAGAHAVRRHPRQPQEDPMPRIADAHP